MALRTGTWQSAPGEVASAVSYALQNGYRHIDGAFMYQVSIFNIEADSDY
jgi:diketogulonate reductase-like aldo/keto reductase